MTLFSSQAQKSRFDGRLEVCLSCLEWLASGLLGHGQRLPDSAGVQIVGSPLHELGALCHMGAAVVGGPHLVALFVGQLPLDHVGAPACLVGHGREQGLKAVGRS